MVGHRIALASGHEEFSYITLTVSAVKNFFRPSDTSKGAIDLNFSIFKFCWHVGIMLVRRLVATWAKNPHCSINRTTRLRFCFVVSSKGINITIEYLRQYFVTMLTCDMFVTSLS